MYAIIELGGRQWKVEPGTRLDVHRLPSAVGAEHTVERVLLAQDGETIQVGHPYLKDARVVCEVLEHRLGPKTIAYYFRRRENWRKTVGHRQGLTRLLVKQIQWKGAVTSVEPEKASIKRPTSKTTVLAEKASTPKTPASGAGTSKSVDKPRGRETTHPNN